MKLASRLSGLLGLLGAVAAVATAQTPSTPPAGAPTTPPAAAAPAPAAAPKTDAMEGLAAVYSDKLAGRQTASGQVFSQSALTAAHPSLPFGTMVKVTNTKNDKTVEKQTN